MEINGIPILMEYSNILGTEGTTVNTDSDSTSSTDTSDPFHSSQTLQSTVTTTVTNEDHISTIEGRVQANVSIKAYKDFQGTAITEPSVSRQNKYIQVYMDIYKNGVLTHDNVNLGRLTPDFINYETQELDYNGRVYYKRISYAPASDPFVTFYSSEPMWPYDEDGRTCYYSGSGCCYFL